MKTVPPLARTICSNRMAGHLRTACATRLLPLLLLLTLPAVVQAKFTYTANNGAITITGYTGPGGAVIIPNMINGLPVTSIGSNAFFSCISLTSLTISNGVTTIGSLAFYSCASLTNVIIPGSVASIGDGAFSSGTSLKGVFFKGNPPSFGSSVFGYYPGTTGWGVMFAGRPTRLWNPLIQTSGPSFGVGPGGFGFNITGTPNIPIVVEACTNLVNATWVPLQSLNLTNGAFAFRDPNWTNYPARNYRIRSP